MYSQETATFLYCSVYLFWLLVSEVSMVMRFFVFGLVVSQNIMVGSTWQSSFSTHGRQRLERSSWDPSPSRAAVLMTCLPSTRPHLLRVLLPLNSATTW